jgi:hypothetical protein
MDTNLNEAQCTALIADIAKTMIPAEPKTVPLQERLAPFRKALRQHRDAGYTPTQLVTILANPKIGIKVSPSFLRKFLTSRAGRPKGSRNESPLRLFENPTAVPASSPAAAKR